MKNRKISECINIRINVGNFQHIEITKYAEEEVEYETKEQLRELEDDLTDDLVDSVIRSMNQITGRLNKGVSEAQEVQEEIGKKIPEWMENTQVPNLAKKANKAEDQVNRVASEQLKNKEETADTFFSLDGSPESEEKIEKVEEAVVEEKSNDFEKDFFNAEVVSETKETVEEKVEEPQMVDDIFDEQEEETDDLFSNLF